MNGADRVDRRQRPSPGPMPRIHLPVFERFRLENGLRVLSVRHDDLPEVSARLVLPYGSVEDPPGRAGTALLTARALTEGSEKRSAREMAAWLDYLGARFTVEVDYDATLLGLHFLSHVLDGAFELLAEIIASPALDADEVSRLRDERLDQIASSLDEPRTIASLRFYEAAFEGHPYAMRSGGVEETVAAIDHTTIRSFHTRHYRPAAATLVLVGDLPESEALRGRVEDAFGRWRGERVEPVELKDPDDPPSRRLWGIEWAGPQSEIRVGGIGIARRDPEYAAVQVMNAILGGLFSSRINMNLREDKGWTYGAASRLDSRKRRGPFYVGTAVDARASVEAVREILNEMERMKEEPAAADEMQLAKNAITLSLPRLFETVSQVSGRIAHQVVYDLPDDYWERYGDIVRRVGPGDVQRAAGRLLETDRATIVIVGPLVDFLNDLADLGPFERRDIRGDPVS